MSGTTDRCRHSSVTRYFTPEGEVVRCDDCPAESRGTHPGGRQQHDE